MMQNRRSEQEPTDADDRADAPAEPAADAVTTPQEPGDEPPATPEEALAESGADEMLRMELEETRERLLRSLAESENLRRRHARDLDEARKYAITAFARELLDVADNLNRALASIPPKARERIDLIKNLADGVSMTEKTLLGVFERHQIVKVIPEIGEKFDHNRHQAMFEVATDAQPAGTVAQVVQPGYVLADRLLRPAMVGVAKAAGGEVRPAEAGPPADHTPEGAPDESGGLPPGERIDTTA
jgi:molecular chaperone GrpE